MRKRDYTYVFDTRKRAGAALVRCRWAWLAHLITALVVADYAKPGKSVVTLVPSGRPIA